MYVKSTEMLLKKKILSLNSKKEKTNYWDSTKAFE